MSDGSPAAALLALPGIAEILHDALEGTPWFARVASGGQAKAQARVLVTCSEDGSELAFGAIDERSGTVFDTWSYLDLRGLRASPARALAYAECFAQIVARATAADRVSEMVPHPALLAVAELSTASDFERERDNVDLAERAVAKLRAASA